MAVKSSLRSLAGQIGGVIRSFAASRGWDQDDIGIAGTLDDQTGRFYIHVGSDRRLDEREWHGGIMNALRREFADMPWMTSKIVLVVRNVPRLEQVFNELGFGEGEVDITELL